MKVMELFLVHNKNKKLRIKPRYYQQFKGGAFRPKPRLTIFALMQKSKQKKSRLRPLRSKNLRSIG